MKEFRLNPIEVDRRPGATSERMAEMIQHFLEIKQIDGPGKNRWLFDQLRDMAKGGGGESGRSGKENEGGYDEKGEHASFTEEGTLRESIYPTWKDEDFIKLLEAIGEPIEYS